MTKPLHERLIEAGDAYGDYVRRRFPAQGSILVDQQGLYNAAEWAREEERRKAKETAAEEALVEKIAIAIHNDGGLSLRDWEHYSHDTAGIDYQERKRKQARAVLNALREEGKLT